MLLVLYVGFIAVLVGSVVTVVVLRRRHAWRWTTMPDAVPGGAGAYREGLLTDDPRLPEQGIPALILAVAGGGYIWAALTFFAFVPVGLLFAALLQMGAEPRLDYGAVGLAAICVSGTGLAASLGVAATSLLRGRPPAAFRAKLAGVWSLAHHLLLVAFVATDPFGKSLEGLLATVAVPSAIGVLLGLGYLAASRLPGPLVPNHG